MYFLSKISCNKSPLSEPTNAMQNRHMLYTPYYHAKCQRFNLDLIFSCFDPHLVQRTSIGRLLLSWWFYLFLDIFFMPLWNCLPPPSRMETGEWNLDFDLLKWVWCYWSLCLQRCRRGGQVTVHSLFAERQQLATHTYAFAGLSKPIMLLLMYDKNRPLYTQLLENYQAKLW